MGEPYCRPLCAGLTSEPRAVAKDLGRLIDAIDGIDSGNVQGRIRDDLRAFRETIIRGLESEGWTLSYDGTNSMKVREPGHKKPFAVRHYRAD
jgi:hypothetical protein